MTLPWRSRGHSPILGVLSVHGLALGSGPNPALERSEQDQSLICGTDRDMISVTKFG